MSDNAFAQARGRLTAYAQSYNKYIESGCDTTLASQLSTEAAEAWGAISDELDALVEKDLGPNQKRFSVQLFDELRAPVTQDTARCVQARIDQLKEIEQKVRRHEDEPRSDVAIVPIKSPPSFEQNDGGLQSDDLFEKWQRDDESQKIHRDEMERMNQASVAQTQRLLSKTRFVLDSLRLHARIRNLDAVDPWRKQCRKRIAGALIALVGQARKEGLGELLELGPGWYSDASGIAESEEPEESKPARSLVQFANQGQKDDLLKLLLSIDKSKRESQIFKYIYFFVERVSHHPGSASKAMSEAEVNWLISLLPADRQLFLAKLKERLEDVPNGIDLHSNMLEFLKEMKSSIGNVENLYDVLLLWNKAADDITNFKELDRDAGKLIDCGNAGTRTPFELLGPINDRAWATGYLIQQAEEFDKACVAWLTEAARHHGIIAPDGDLNDDALGKLELMIKPVDIPSSDKPVGTDAANGKPSESPSPANPNQGDMADGAVEIADPPLSERALLVLKVLLLENVAHSDCRMTTAKIVKKAVGDAADPNSFKEVIVELKEHGYLGTREGRSGGVWLTVAGVNRANKL